MALPIAEERNLVRHAREELRRAGMFDADADYGPEFAEAIVDVIARFASWGHSGGSASLAIEILTRLLSFETLMPITSDPAEWIDHSSVSGTPMWQSRRNPAVFSVDGGQTWYDLNAKESDTHG